jgi:hypothetical protein
MDGRAFRRPSTVTGAVLAPRMVPHPLKVTADTQKKALLKRYPGIPRGVPQSPEGGNPWELFSPNAVKLANPVVAVLAFLPDWIIEAAPVLVSPQQAEIPR